MVVGAFPLVKLAMLGIRHISKPVSTAIKRAATKNLSFKKLIVFPPARLYHTIDVRTKMWMLGLGQPHFIPPLTDAMTIQMGGDILGELVIFIIGALLLIGEVSRQAKKDRKKQKKIKLKEELLEQRITELTEKVSRQGKEIIQLKRMANN
ncbi:hypothetical protein KR009_002611 [Drosophila setifemur]|nr:hypothetical protein KR009_002611 [Drosophila setifemur]